MSGYVNLPPGGPADGFDMPARPWAVQARAGFYPAAPTALANRLPAAAGREKWAFGTHQTCRRPLWRLKSPTDL